MPPLPCRAGGATCRWNARSPSMSRLKYSCSTSHGSSTHRSRGPERLDVGVARHHRGERELDVDDRLRGEAGHRGRADVVDAGDQVGGERGDDAGGLGLVPLGPGRIGVGDAVIATAPLGLRPAWLGFRAGERAARARRRATAGPGRPRRSPQGATARRRSRVRSSGRRPGPTSSSIASTRPSGLRPVTRSRSPTRSTPWWWCDEQVRSPDFVTAARYDAGSGVDRMERLGALERHAVLEQPRHVRAGAGAACRRRRRSSPACRGRCRAPASPCVRRPAAGRSRTRLGRAPRRSCARCRAPRRTARGRRRRRPTSSSPSKGSRIVLGGPGLARRHDRRASPRTSERGRCMGPAPRSRRRAIGRPRRRRGGRRRRRRAADSRRTRPIRWSSRRRGEGSEPGEHLAPARSCAAWNRSASARTGGAAFPHDVLERTVRLLEHSSHMSISARSISKCHWTPQVRSPTRYAWLATPSPLASRVAPSGSSNVSMCHWNTWSPSA